MKIKAHEIESAVLGLAIENEECLTTVLSELTTDDFTDDYKEVFDNIQVLFTDDKPVNRATVIEKLGVNGITEARVFVDTILSDSKGVKPSGILTACEYLRPYTKARKLKELCATYHKEIDKNVHNVDEFLSEAGSNIFDLLSDNDGERIHSAKDYIDQGLEEIQQPVDMSNRVYSGLDSDELIKGFRPGQLVIIGGKTSHGKSSLAQNLMYRSAISGTHTALCTMEMTNQEVTERIFSMASRVKLDNITERKLTKEDVASIKKEAETIKESAGYTIVDESMTIEKLYATARRLKMKDNMGMLIVDYLQQVRSNGRTREEEVSNVVRGLKDIATDLMIPVVALSQFSRAAADGRPQLHHLRESGAIEQWANVAILLWNPAVDGVQEFSNSKAEGRWSGESTKNIVELNVAKNRGGKTGTCKVGFDPTEQRFYNVKKPGGLPF